MKEYDRYIMPLSQERERSDTEKAVKWLLIGAAVGAGLALVMAPVTGKQLREAIAWGYRKTADGIGRGSSRVRQTGSKLLNFRRANS